MFMGIVVTILSGESVTLILLNECGAKLPYGFCFAYIHRLVLVPGFG